MNFRKILGKYVVKPVLGLSLIGSLAGKPLVAQDRTEEVNIQKAMEVLNARDISYVRFLPNGYITKLGNDTELMGLAGILDGTTRVYKNKGENKSGYTVIGFYSRAQQDELEKVLEMADENKDKIITKQETQNLKEELYEAYAQ